jgi:hypothetical protein
VNDNGWLFWEHLMATAAPTVTALAAFAAALKALRQSRRNGAALTEVQLATSSMKLALAAAAFTRGLEEGRTSEVLDALLRLRDALTPAETARAVEQLQRALDRAPRQEP